MMLIIMKLTALNMIVMYNAGRPLVLKSSLRPLVVDICFLP